MDENKSNKKNTPNLNSIHELQKKRRELRQKNIYDKLKQIKKEEEKLKNNSNYVKNNFKKQEIKTNNENLESNINIKDKKNKNKKDELRNKKKNSKEKISKTKEEKAKKQETKKEKYNKLNKQENKNKQKKINEKKKAKKQKLKTAKQWKKSRITKSIVIAILLIIISLMSYYIYLIYLNGGGLKGLIAASLGHTPNKVENLKSINVLVLGTNEDNTDSIIVASYNPKTQEASMLSIPRDTFVGTNVNTAPASDKINAIYANRGIKQMVKKVEDLTGLDIPYYVILKTENISKLIDLIGGIEFDVPIDMNYGDMTQDLYIDLKKGKQIIRGKEAEMLLRFRHNSDGTTYPAEYGPEDLGRMKTQKNFIKAAIKTLISKFDISAIYEITSKANEFVETNIKFNDYKDYIPYLIECNPDDIKVSRVEGNGVLTTYYFFIPDYNSLDKIIFDLFVFSDDERRENPESFRVQRNINQIVIPDSSTLISPEEQAEASKRSSLREKEEREAEGKRKIDVQNNKYNETNKNINTTEEVAPPENKKPKEETKPTPEDKKTPEEDEKKPTVPTDPKKDAKVENKNKENLKG